MSTELLLESYLKSLRLPAFLESYQPLAHEAARTNLSYERYSTSARTRRGGPKGAPIASSEPWPMRTSRCGSELAEFDWSCVPDVPKPRILDLAQGGYISRIEPVILIGKAGRWENPINSLPLLT